MIFRAVYIHNKTKKGGEDANIIFRIVVMPRR